VHVDLVQRPLGAATHLLLCSDGLWGMVADNALRDALLHARWPQDACHTLIDLANEAGGEDNISALVVQL
jgi:serine/threonine protein phosphatase PrpC